MSGRSGASSSQRILLVRVAAAKPLAPSGAVDDASLVARAVCWNGLRRIGDFVSSSSLKHLTTAPSRTVVAGISTGGLGSLVLQP